MVKTLMLAFVLILGFGCKKPTKVESFMEALTVYVEAFAPGGSATLVKENTVRGGQWIVVAISDGTNSNYIAINIETFDPETMTTAEDVLNWALAAGGTIEDGVEVYETNDGTPVPGYFVGDEGHLYETTTATGKDLEKVQAVQELFKVKATAEKLSTQFGFSTERAFEVAKFISNFNKISKTRALTKSDYNAFSEEVMGVDYEGLQEALNGDVEASNKLIDSAATRNEVSPEAIRALINETL